MTDPAVLAPQPERPPEVDGKAAKTVGYYAGFIALGLVMASLGPTLPGLAEQTGTQLSQISFLFLTRSSGYLLGSFLVGRVYDRVPGHPVMATVLALMAAMMALVPVVPFLWLLAAVLFVLGVGEGTLDVGGNTLLVRVHVHNVDPYMNALHFFFGVGATLSPFIIVRIADLSGGIAWAYWSLALLIVPVSVWMFSLSSPRVKAVSSDGTVKVGRPGLIAMVAGCFFLCVGAEAGFGGWIYTYSSRLGLADTTTAGYLTSAFWGALTVGRLIGIPISGWCRPTTVLIGDLIGCLASVGIVLMWPVSALALWIGTIGAGLFVASIFATLLNFAGRHITITGRVTGWFFVGTSTGAMSVPWVIGQFFEPVGPVVMMWVIMVVLVLALGLLGGLVRFASRMEGR